MSQFTWIILVVKKSIHACFQGFYCKVVICDSDYHKKDNVTIGICAITDILRDG